MPVTPNSSGLVHGSDTGEKRGAAKGEGALCAPHSNYLFRHKSHYQLQLQNWLRPTFTTPPPSRPFDATRTVRTSTCTRVYQTQFKKKKKKNCFNRRERRILRDFLPSVVDIKSYDASFCWNGSSEVRTVGNNERYRCKLLHLSLPFLPCRLILHEKVRMTRVFRKTETWRSLVNFIWLKIFIRREFESLKRNEDRIFIYWNDLLILKPPNSLIGQISDFLFL